MRLLHSGRVPLLLLAALVAAGCAGTARAAGCPFRHLSAFGAAGEAAGWAGRALRQTTSQPKMDVEAVKALDLKKVKADLAALMTDSQPWWPADDGNYGGFFIRLAWHCHGSYRLWDGRGGCNGARIRFLPELAWEDNTNLHMARRLLAPIKAKYPALSWGDLIATAGTVAIENMGGPAVGVCLGRVDDVDGTASLPLGPTPEQQMIAPCTAGNGKCEAPLGQDTLGLIYVNPEGVNGEPVPVNSVLHIRRTFTAMGMTDRETVALIGGGHAFGKAHGACKTGAGPGPKENPNNPWPGTCGSGELQGKGPNTFTSGFEGQWTTTPSQWSNQFFRNLVNFKWEKHMGPGGHWQWRPVGRKAGSNSSAAQDLPDLMMFTTDLALLEDPVYKSLVVEYAGDLAALTTHFGQAWYKLLTRGMGPVSRCLGKGVPPAQAFQLPLPPPSAKQPDWAKVTAQVRAVMAADASAASNFAALAWQCASTFRATDYAGGCNGARIRFPPQSTWPANRGLVDAAMQQLQPVKKSHSDLSWADLIVLAGTLAVEQQAAGSSRITSATVGAPFSFCPGRTDASSAAGTEQLAPRKYSSPELAFKDGAVVQGLTAREAVVLAARPRSAAQQQRQGFSGTWSPGTAVLSNAYFKQLLDTKWEADTSPSGRAEFRAPAAPGVSQERGALVYMMPEDLVIKQDPALAALAREYAQDNAKFVKDFAAAWKRMMNADRFDGPVGSVC